MIEDGIDGVLSEAKDKSVGLHMARLTAPLQIGRNDLCPCGSGLKFKKCHSECRTPADIMAASFKEGKNVNFNVLSWLENNPQKEKQ
jgi:hypothetical protein